MGLEMIEVPNYSKKKIEYWVIDNNGDNYKCIGAFTEREDADKLMDIVKKEGYKGGKKCGKK